MYIALGFWKFLKKKNLKEIDLECPTWHSPLNFNFSGIFKAIQLTFYQIYLPVFALKIVFDTYKFSGTTENRAILLISSNLVQNYYYGDQIFGHFH